MQALERLDGDETGRGRSQSLEQQQFIEEVGLLFERDGFPRMSGRIFGWLLISNPPYPTTVKQGERGK